MWADLVSKVEFWAQRCSAAGIGAPSVPAPTQNTRWDAGWLPGVARLSSHSGEGGWQVTCCHGGHREVPAEVPWSTSPCFPPSFLARDRFALRTCWPRAPPSPRERKAPLCSRARAPARSRARGAGLQQGWARPGSAPAPSARLPRCAHTFLIINSLL